MVENRAVSKESVAHRAYELFVERGCKNGRDVEDWLRAEEELNRNPVMVPVKRDKGPNNVSRAN